MWKRDLDEQVTDTGDKPRRKRSFAFYGAGARPRAARLSFKLFFLSISIQSYTIKNYLGDSFPSTR